MKVSRWLHPHGVGLFVAACLLVTGCGQSASSKKAAVATAKKSRLDWNLKTLVAAYQQAGNTDPVWDGFATNALTEFARQRCNAAGPGESPAEIIATNCDAAIQAGCNDPMVRYLYIRYSMSQTNSPQKFADAFCRVAEDMQKSSYPDIRKFYAAVRAMDQLSYVYGTNVQTMPVAQRISSLPGQDLLSVLQDKTTPPEEVYEVCDEGLSGLNWRADDYIKGYSMVEPLLSANWPNEPTTWLLKGQAYAQMAWNARGRGYANTVTPQGWQTYSNDMAVAETDLEHAWKLNPNDARIAVKMMWVEIGLDKGRDGMELWFDRAMKLDPKDYDACSTKLLFIEPKWGGSTGDMLEFGRECIQNTNWGGNVPLIILDAHANIRSEYTDPADRTNYWQQADVWPDLQAAYERFFEVNPNATGRYYQYAWYAYHCDQWEKFLELLPKLEPLDYSYFGGKDEFNKMVQLAKEHASHPAAAPQ